MSFAILYCRRTNAHPTDEVSVDEQDSEERHLEDLDFVTATLHQTRVRITPQASLLVRLESAWRRIWDQRAVLRGMSSDKVHLF